MADTYTRLRDLSPASADELDDAFVAVDRAGWDKARRVLARELPSAGNGSGDPPVDLAPYLRRDQVPRMALAEYSPTDPADLVTKEYVDAISQSEGVDLTPFLRKDGTTFMNDGYEPESPRQLATKAYVDAVLGGQITRLDPDIMVTPQDADPLVGDGRDAGNALGYCADEVNKGRIAFLPKGRYPMNRDPLPVDVPYNDGGVMEGGGWVGQSMWGAVIEQNKPGADVFRVGFGGQAKMRPFWERMSLRSPSTGGLGINVKDSCRCSNGHIDLVHIFTGDTSVWMHDEFNYVFDRMHFSSHKGDGLDLQGGNATSLRRCYASEFYGNGSVGYKIARYASLYGCTGLDEGFLWGLFGVMDQVTGTAQSGTADAIKIAASDAAADYAYQHARVEITAGRGAGQWRRVRSYSKATKTLRVWGAWTTIPDATSQYRIRDNSWAAGARNSQIVMSNCNIERTKSSGIRFTRGTKHVNIGCLFYQTDTTIPYEGNIMLGAQDPAFNHGVLIMYPEFGEEPGVTNALGAGNNIACYKGNPEIFGFVGDNQYLDLTVNPYVKRGFNAVVGAQLRLPRMPVGVLDGSTLNAPAGASAGTLYRHPTTRAVYVA
jgi:hypothetical protein